MLSGIPSILVSHWLLPTPAPETPMHPPALEGRAEDGMCPALSSPFFLQDNLPLIVLQVHGPHLLLLLSCQLLLAFRGCCCGVIGRHLPFSTTTTPFLPQTENATGLGQGQGQMKASNPQATSSQLYNSYHTGYNPAVPGGDHSVSNSRSE